MSANYSYYTILYGKLKELTLKALKWQSAILFTFKCNFFQSPVNHYYFLKNHIIKNTFKSERLNVISQA